MLFPCIHMKNTHRILILPFILIPLYMKWAYINRIGALREAIVKDEVKTSVNGFSIMNVVETLLKHDDKMDPISWFDKRKKILSQSHSTKVYMFAYMRGGSSLGGTLFDVDPNGLLWYEPLDQFFMAYLGQARWGLPMHATTKDGVRRVVPEEEHTLYLDYISNMLTCKYQDLPMEALTHEDFIGQSKALRFMNTCTKGAGMTSCKNRIKQHCGSTKAHIRDPTLAWANKCPQVIQYLDKIQPLNSTNELENDMKSKFQLETTVVKDFIGHRLCMDKVRSNVTSCMSKALSKCHEQKIHAVEVLRSNMDALEDVIKKLPDIYVVYYVRDPRAIARSTIKVKFNTGGTNITEESRYICTKMEQDLQDYERLSVIYPGVFIRVKYEDLVLDPKQFGKTVYNHLGLDDCSPEWLKVVQRSLHGSKASGSFGTARKNGTEVIGQWRKEIKPEELTEVNKICKNVLTTLDYVI